MHAGILVYSKHTANSIDFAVMQSSHPYVRVRGINISYARALCNHPKFDNSWNTITRLATCDHHGYDMAWQYVVVVEWYLIANRYQISNLWYICECSTTHMHKGHSNSHTPMKHQLSIIIFVCYLLVLWQIWLHLNLNSFRQHYINNSNKWCSFPTCCHNNELVQVGSSHVTLF
jgi:hypothetical protein